MAIPIGVLALILRAHDSATVDATAGPLITPKKAKVGDVAPDFTLPGLDGKPVTLSGLRGRAGGARVLRVVVQSL